MNIAMRMVGAGLSHEGRVRQANEDGLLQRDDVGLWAVADGMGGHEGGQFASAALVGAPGGAGR